MRNLPRGVLTALAGVVALLAVLAVRLPAAQAGVAPPGGGGGGQVPPVDQTPTTGGCKTYQWGTTMPRLVMHLRGWKLSSDSTDPGNLDQEQQMEQATRDVVDQFNAMGGTTAKITGVSFTNDDEPYSYETAVNDGKPTIHIDWTPTSTFNSYLTDSDGAIGLTSAPFISSATGCQIIEEHITFLDPYSHAWQYGTPFDEAWANYGITFNDAGTGDGAGRTWFRPSLLHELLHAFYLHHTKTVYSMLNHQGVERYAADPHQDDIGGFPWANRDPSDAIRPLGYELGILRARYPADDTRYDVAALNTWFGPPGDATDDAGWQVANCKPSLGSGWAPNPSSDTCGVDGTSPGNTSVCRSDSLRARFTLANYSTDSMHVQAWMYFSKDSVFDGTDPISDSSTSVDLGAAKSTNVQATWSVPKLAEGIWHPIVWLIAEHVDANGAGDAKSVRSDWIPLRGTITANSQFSSACIKAIPR
jgi:hypothetical protein